MVSYDIATSQYQVQAWTTSKPDTGNKTNNKVHNLYHFISVVPMFAISKHFKGDKLK